MAEGLGRGFGPGTVTIAYHICVGFFQCVITNQLLPHRLGKTGRVDSFIEFVILYNTLA